MDLLFGNYHNHNIYKTFFLQNFNYVMSVLFAELITRIHKEEITCSFNEAKLKMYQEFQQLCEDKDEDPYTRISISSPSR